VPVPDDLSREERKAVLQHEIRDVLNAMMLRERAEARAEAEDLRTWPGRIKAAWLLVNQPGGLAILLLGVGLALYTGYLPSPVTRTEAKVDQHIATVDRIVHVRSEEQRELVGALKRLTEQIEQRNRRDKLRECAEIRDVDLRRECLR
jgi:hypothetical protein